MTEEKKAASGVILFDKYLVTKDGDVYSTKFVNRMVTKPRIHKLKVKFVHGYCKVCLSVNGQARMHTVHSLVLRAFVSERPEGMQALHRNGIKSDNRLCNLRWGTPQENSDDRIAHGNSQKGELCSSAKLNNESVLKIRQLWSEGVNAIVLSKMFKVHHSTIRKVVHRKQWSHI